MGLTRQRDDFHWTSNRLLSYNKTYNFAVSGRGPGKTTDITRYMMQQHKKGYMCVLIKRQIVDVNAGTIEDFQNSYNILQDEDSKIELVYKKGDMRTGLCDVYIKDDPEPFFRVVALSNPKYRLKGLAFDRALTTIVFDEYKISGSEKYLKDEYSKFQELYGTLCRFGKEQNGKIIPPRVIFLGNNYSLTDPYIAHMKIPVAQIKPGKIITGENWAFEDILINEKLREYLLQQNPLFQFGDDAYNKYALEGESVSDQRIQVMDKQPDNFKLSFIFYIEGKYLGIYRNTKVDETTDILYWVGVIENYNISKREVVCFDYDSLIEGTHLLSKEDKVRFLTLVACFRWRRVSFKSIYEGYLFEQIHELL